METERKIVAHIKEIGKVGFVLDRRAVGPKYGVFL